MWNDDWLELEIATCVNFLIVNLRCRMTITNKVLSLLASISLLFFSANDTLEYLSPTQRLILYGEVKRTIMSAILSADDLNDFISPGVACIKPIETLPSRKDDASVTENPVPLISELWLTT